MLFLSGAPLSFLNTLQLSQNKAMRLVTKDRLLIGLNRVIVDFKF